jgi:glucose-1-phosphate adenylyltransferase
MKDSVIRKGAKLNKAIIAEQVVIDENVEMGIGEMAPSKLDKKVYAFDLVTIGEKSYVPKNVKLGKNTVVMGETTPEDFTDGLLESGDYIIKGGDR